MIDMEPLSHSLPGDNCLTTAVSNILQYKNFNSYREVWKQCGLNYYSTPNGYGHLTSRYMPFMEELEIAHNITMELYEEDNTDFLVNLIKENIRRGEPCIVFVNTYDLPFSIYYKDKALSHCITVIDYTTEYVTVIDDFYTYKGQLKWKDLLKATKYKMGWPIKSGYKRSFCTISTKNSSDKLRRQEIYEIISRNYTALSGSIPSEKIRKTNNIPVLYTEISSGMPALKKFIDEYRRYVFSEKIPFTEEFFYSLYSMFTQMSNSRYLYSNILKKGIVFESGLEDLVNSYYDVAQDWKVASNIMLKSYMANLNKRVNLTERMFKRVEQLLLKEKDCLHQTEKILKEYNNIKEGGVY